MKNPTPFLIIDDEKGAIRTISDYVRQMPRLNLIETYTDPLKPWPKYPCYKFHI